MRVCVVGAGYAGLVTATCLAELDHDVVCVESDAEKIAALERGETTIHKQYIPELLERHRNRKLRFTTPVEQGTRNSAVMFVAVNTPSCGDGCAELSYVESVVRTIARSANGYKVIVEKSTVPIYIYEWIHRVMVLDAQNCREFDVVSNPEFLREGTALRHLLCPDRIVVGCHTGRGAWIMRERHAQDDRMWDVRLQLLVTSVVPVIPPGQSKYGNPGKRQPGIELETGFPGSGGPFQNPAYHPAIPLRYNA